MKNNFSFLWHDYETWGVNPRIDRASQFAAIRTDYDCNIIADPIMLYCKPSDDFLPHPQSALITHLTPQEVYQKGLPEALFFQTIEKEMIQANTCSVGYNSLRFDDEVTRFGFYRNFIDPYAREWQKGNSRWDIIDLVRMAYALRPEGIQWPIDESTGKVSFRLEALSKANNIEHVGAHDALSDVYATIGLAKLIKDKQPRLFDFYFSLRKKDEVRYYLDLTKQSVVLHVSGMYPLEQGCIAPIMPLLQHPTNTNELIVFDLRQDPQLLLSYDLEGLQENLYTKRDKETTNETLYERVTLKSIHINKSPALSPMGVLSAEKAAHWKIDWKRVEQHRKTIQQAPQLIALLKSLYSERRNSIKNDADQALYDGFISRSDRKLCESILSCTSDDLMKMNPVFQDSRLNTLYFRYLARNWPEKLTEEQHQRWRIFCQSRIMDGEFGNVFTMTDFLQAIETATEQRLEGAEMKIIEQLMAWIGR